MPERFHRVTFCTPGPWATTTLRVRTVKLRCTVIYMIEDVVGGQFLPLYRYCLCAACIVHAVICIPTRYCYLGCLLYSRVHVQSTVKVTVSHSVWVLPCWYYFCVVLISIASSTTLWRNIYYTSCELNTWSCRVLHAGMFRHCDFWTAWRLVCLTCSRILIEISWPVWPNETFLQLHWILQKSLLCKEVLCIQPVSQNVLFSL